MIGGILSFEEMQEKASEAAEFMRLFSTPSRLMLLCYIAQTERSVSEIQSVLRFKQPALSQQLAELRQARLVETRRQSRQVYYSIADSRVSMVMDLLMRLFCEAGAKTQRAAISARAPAQSRGGGAIAFPGEMAWWARLEPWE
ncbi:MULTISPECIES: metalloregulator ArsR/SmtB family transcription factor [unclassified Rhizobium]|uniref:ArsR/SmtB family transcription factor n=1 Tax=unclassified Rhizobium TaxID=2613769 RepID=UPI0016216A65|nr:MULTISPECIES: metalloregulator ArsR/SmtB family transcription factor [unclassified Rhizobium]MBB3545234.1 DNA-binding transcriptional ArsR family regulator [Rhizobium sp. BK399]MCS3743212.1 DNA-binding transcriptional ArsR family regulator [Rhizobium sp. BK661]MCS4096360.1 DNA-binding transcriptional ArsR family regulator [Rhizobium sp. BK176]